MFEPIRVDDRGEIWPGMWVKYISFRIVDANPVTKMLETRSAFGRAVVVDQQKCEIRVYPFYDLINSNKGDIRGIGCCPEPNVNLGATVKDFMEGSRRESAPAAGLRPAGPYASDVKRCIYASNSLHTNFVRPNGFVVLDGNLICKLDYAPGLDCDEFMPLDGLYTALVLDTHNPRVATIEFKNGQPVGQLPELAISGPTLVADGKDVSARVPFRPRPGSKEPYGVSKEYRNTLRLPPGPTKNDEVNYPPPTTMASFTAFGVSKDGHIILVSMFEELRGKGNGCNLGVTIYEMARLLTEKNLGLEAKEAILGGGGADTQQFLRGDRPQYMTAPVRARSPEQGERPEVEGARGLGAIIAVLAKS